jgi:hypothetical protein
MKVVRFVILTVLVVAVLYEVIISLVAIPLTAIDDARRKAEEAKYQAELEGAASRVIPSDFILTESKFYPMRGIDTKHRLTRTYSVNKPRDVVIDELLRSLRSHGYSPDKTDIPGEEVIYATYFQTPFFYIMIPYEDPPIHITVDVAP